MAGKILCPNEKCKAKIGNYDWAGVQCGCKEWVVPVSLASIWPSAYTLWFAKLLSSLCSGILYRPEQGRRGLVILASDYRLRKETEQIEIDLLGIIVVTRHYKWHQYKMHGHHTAVG